MPEKTFASNLVRYERQWAGASHWKSVLALTHPTAVILFGLMVFILTLLATQGRVAPSTLLVLAVVMMLGQAAIGLFNEVFDYELDRVAKPWRALAAGYISRRTAVAAGVVCGAVGFGLAALVSLPCALVFALGIGCGILYSARLKFTLFSGVPYLIAYPLLPIWVWVSLDKFNFSLLVIYPLALPLVLAIHLVNQLRDFDDDQKMNMHSLVQTLGKWNASALCFVLLLASPLMLWLPFLWERTMFAFLLVLVCSLLHWGVIGSLLVRWRGQSDPEFFRGLFKRLQLTGPLFLISCFLLLGN